jgi:hypothetical protein
VGFVLPLERIGKARRLEKLKTVRLTATASFARAKNVNDITILWCWEPKITIRFEENLPDDTVELLKRAAKQAGKSESALFLQMVQKTREKLQHDPETARRYDKEARRLILRRDYKPFLHTVLMIEDGDVYMLFNGRLALREKGPRASEARNLCFALSVSNLVPLKRHSFQFESRPDVPVKDMPCRHVTARDRLGTELDLYFDKRTDLLVKIAHWGHGSGRGAGAGAVRWEHYFSDYRETDGLKQWRKLQIHKEGKEFATIDVSEVQYFDKLLPEMQPLRKAPAGGKGGPERPAPRSAAEDKAAALLAQAREAIRNGNAALARVRLRILISEHAKTPAAREGAKLLKDLEKQ